MRIKLVAAFVAVLSAVAAFQLAPGANADTSLVSPDGVSITRSGDALLLSWNPVAGAEKYNVYQNEVNLATTEAGTTSLTVDSAHLVADYYVTACAADACSASDSARINGVAWPAALGGDDSIIVGGLPEDSVVSAPLGDDDDDGDSPDGLTRPGPAKPSNGPNVAFGEDAQINDNVPGPTNLAARSRPDDCRDLDRFEFTWDAPERSVEHYRMYRITRDGRAIEIDRTTQTWISVDVMAGVESIFEVRAFRQVTTGPVLQGSDSDQLYDVVLSAASNRVTVEGDDSGFGSYCGPVGDAGPRETPNF